MDLTKKSSLSKRFLILKALSDDFLCHQKVKNQALLKSHFPISLKLAFLPYIRIPILYILPDNHTKKKTDKIKRAAERIICQAGGLNASLAGMTIGENKGKMEAQTAKLLLGALIATIMI